MELYFVYPEEGEPLVNGKLIAENGEEIQGIWLQQVWNADGRLKDAVQVQFVMTINAIPDLEEHLVQQAIDAMLNVRALTGSRFETGD